MNLLFDNLQHEIETSLMGLDERQTQLRPSNKPAAWSIQQVVEHLLLSYASTAGVFETRIMRNSPTKASPNLAQHLGRFVLLQIGYFPRNRRAPLAVTPSADGKALPGYVLALQAKEQLESLDRLTATAERMFGRRRAITHGVLGPLRMSEWRQFHRLHGAHHAKQIRAIRADHGV